jgi:hypothetical protein
MTIYRGKVVSFSAGTWKASIRLDGSAAQTLDSVATARNIASAEMTAGRSILFAIACLLLLAGTLTATLAPPAAADTAPRPYRATVHMIANDGPWRPGEPTPILGPDTPEGEAVALAVLNTHRIVAGQQPLSRDPVVNRIAEYRCDQLASGYWPFQTPADPDDAALRKLLADVGIFPLHVTEGHTRATGGGSLAHYAVELASPFVDNPYPLAIITNPNWTAFGLAICRGSRTPGPEPHVLGYFFMVLIIVELP